MYRIAVAALIVAATGCATTGGGAGGPGGNAAVTGVVRLPESGLQGNPCDSLRVMVSTAGATAALGDAQVKLSRGRCSYTVSNLPSNSELQIGVTPGADLKCASGAAPTATPEPAALKLRDYETATRDFQLACGA